MPEQDGRMDWRGALQLSLLLMAVPAQYYIMQYFPASQEQSQGALINLINQVQQVKKELFSLPAWQQWCIRIINTLANTYTTHIWVSDRPITGNTGESPAVEVIIHQDPEGFYANSHIVRSPRPANVKFKVGQVIVHKRWSYKGVIIGWDTEAKASLDWLEKNHPEDKTHWRTQPNYAILVDSRDRAGAQLTYIPQENILLASSGSTVKHPLLMDFFDGYDGVRYRARPALKELYPDD